jgi:SAM-dependent methyltransferase
VLDFGCADGLFLRNLPAARRIGVEVNESVRKLCENMSVTTGIHVELASELSEIKPAIVDVAISNHSLEHILDPLRALQELWRVLRPGGRLIIVTPFDDWRSRIHRNWTPVDPDNHLYTWSPRNLGNLLSEAGFRVESVEFRRFTLSSRLTWISTMFGNRMFHLAGRLVALYRRNGEVFARVQKPSVPT